MKHTLPEIRHNVDGFQSIADLHQETKEAFLEDIDIDMSTTSWFDADMCAPFGAILHCLRNNFNSVSLIRIGEKQKKILSKNNFLSHYGQENLPDTYKTTISYQRFDTGDSRLFAQYVENELMTRHEIPHMSDGLKKKFKESIFEIFNNAAMHSKSEDGIFSCGQFFPKRNTIDFCIADLGIGIRQNIKNALGKDFSPEEAIRWATSERNTTKREGIPGGLGLKLLQEFIDLNKGCIQIVSDAGYWRRKNGSESTQSLTVPFPGTVVALEINTADTNSYCLSSESEDNIF